MAGLSDQGKNALHFMSTLLYTPKFDGAIRTGLKWNKGAAELIQHEDVAAEWQKVTGEQDDEPMAEAAEDLEETAEHAQDIMGMVRDLFDNEVAAHKWLTKAEKKDQTDEVRQGKEHAERLAKTQCTCIDASCDLAKMTNHLASLAVSKIHGEEGRNILVLWDVDQSGWSRLFFLSWAT